MENLIVLPLGRLETNCYLLRCGEESLVVDPGDEAEYIIRTLEQEGMRPSLVLLTHGHFDHIGAAVQLRERYGSTVVIGAGDVELLSDPQKSLALEQDARYVVSPDRTVGEGDSVSCGSSAFTVLETPGHTRGGVCYLGEGMLFCGDTLFYGSCGRTDFYGGNLSDMRRSLQRLSALPPETKVLPGHGPQSTIGREVKSNLTMRSLEDDDFY